MDEIQNPRLHLAKRYSESNTQTDETLEKPIKTNTNNISITITTSTQTDELKDTVPSFINKADQNTYVKKMYALLQSNDSIEKKLITFRRITNMLLEIDFPARPRKDSI